MNDSLRLRLTLFGLLVLALFGALVARLWYLQVLTQEEFEVQARENLIRATQIGAPRGRILDVNGNVLVDNRVTNLVTVDKFKLNEALPRESEQRELAVRLAREISQTGRLIKADRIADLFRSPKFGAFDIIPVATDVSEEFSILLGERLDEFPGVDVTKTTVRDYPYGNLAAHILGRVGPISEDELLGRAEHAKLYVPTDEIGKNGIERSFEDILRGTPGARRIEVDARDQIINVLEDIQPIPGNDVRLTIDINLQAKVEQELRTQIEAARGRRVETAASPDSEDFVESFDFHEANAGAAVMLDPRDGSVLALASYPTFDPQLFIGGINDADWLRLNDPNAHFPLVNRAIAGEYSPGSTFKLISSYAALDSGLIGDRGVVGIDQYVRDAGVFWIPERSCPQRTRDCRFQNAGAQDNGNVNLRDALIVSSDTYFYRLGFEFEERSGFISTSLQDAANRFGLGSRSGIALPDEKAGRVPTAASMQALYDSNPEAFPFANTWTTGNTIQLAIGQGDLVVTPLQLANAYAVFANGGTLYQPKIGSAEIDAVTNEVVQEYGPRVVDEIFISDEWHQVMSEGLSAVVRDAPLLGTARDAFEDFPLNSWPVAGKTGTVEVVGKQDSSAFIGYGPLPNPEYVMFVYVEQGGFGARTAGRTVASVLEAIATDNVETVATRQQIEEFYQQYRPDLDDGEGFGLTGDAAADLAAGFDPDNPDAFIEEDVDPDLEPVDGTTEPAPAEPVAEDDPATAPAEAEGEP